jgi:1-deoxy-D-xylulose-5-phosphate synthase
MLESVVNPKDLTRFNYSELDSLAKEIRDLLIEKVSKSGGHLGPNLGVVELTIALHRIFESPKDVLLFDTGHQTYVHKILTGRALQFDGLRTAGGLAGYPSREESEHDVIENSHASTSLSWGFGIAKGFKISKTRDRTVVAVIGDGALTGGMAWEALNNIASQEDLKLVVVVNDNGRSYSPTVGGLTKYLTTLRTTKGYEQFLDWGKAILEKTPVVGHPIYETLHGVKKGIKDIVAPQGMFEDLGMKYFGPIDGHNIEELERALSQAKNFAGPVLVHVITEKGHGYNPAINDLAEKFHAVGVVDPETGLPLKKAGISWTDIFSAEIAKLGRERKDIVAITAAMLGPTGLSQFQHEFPDRTIDVGIAEQHAVTAAAGLAFAGLHPVVAIYSTFLNRAYDQLLLDVALHNAGVTFVLDRAGITGDDGPSHNGMWDLALSGIVPNLAIAAPRDAVRLREELREAVAISTGPTLIRYPKGAVIEEIVAISRHHGIDILFESELAEVLIVSVGAVAGIALEVAAVAKSAGINITVIDPRWVKPISSELIAMAWGFDLVVVIEDGIKHAGIGSSLREAFQDNGVQVPVHCIGLPLAFIEHGKRADILNSVGLGVEKIVLNLQEWKKERSTW